MTTEEVIDCIQCALGCGCSQVCNSKLRGDCTDAEVIEAKDLAIEALQNQEILLELLDNANVSDICAKMPKEFCGTDCDCIPNKQCFLEYCRMLKIGKEQFIEEWK